jgi:hypothetical protein
MVARAGPNAATLISRRLGLAAGVIAAVPPAGLSLIAFLGSYAWFGITLAVACLGSGALIGATIGRGLAAKPDPLGVLMVAAIAVAVGDVVAAVVYPIESVGIDSIDVIFGGLLLGIPAYFFLAFPGVVFFILLARRVATVAAP